MSYQESDGTVTLTMSREDYERLLMALGVAAAHAAVAAAGNGLLLTDWVALANRINEGNPNYTPYRTPENPQASTDNHT